MTAATKRLQGLFSSLSDVDQETVMAFVEYLSHRQRLAVSLSLPLAPQVIVRPASESVPAALKRLRLIYPMLDASALLAEASDLLSQYLMLGRSASDVIDEMEALFQRHYQAYCKSMEV